MRQLIFGFLLLHYLVSVGFYAYVQKTDGDVSASIHAKTYAIDLDTSEFNYYFKVNIPSEPDFLTLRVSEKAYEQHAAGDLVTFTRDSYPLITGENQNLPIVTGNTEYSPWYVLARKLFRASYYLNIIAIGSTIGWLIFTVALSFAAKEAAKRSGASDLDPRKHKLKG